MSEIVPALSLFALWGQVFAVTFFVSLLSTVAGEVTK